MSADALHAMASQAADLFRGLHETADRRAAEEALFQRAMQTVGATPHAAAARLLEAQNDAPGNDAEEAR